MTIIKLCAKSLCVSSVHSLYCILCKPKQGSVDDRDDDRCFNTDGYAPMRNMNI